MKSHSRTLLHAGAWWVLAAFAGRAHAHGEMHEQLAVITRRIEAAPDRASLYLERAELYRVHGDWALAAKDYARAGTFDPQLRGLEPARMRMLVEAGHLSEAQVAIAAWLSAHPADADVHLLAARSLVLRGSPAQALEAYARALALDPSRGPEVYLARAEVQRGLGPEGAQRALVGLDEGMARLGVLVSLQLRAVDLELELERFDAALARIETLRQGARRQEAWLARRAAILGAARRPLAAADAWRECLEHIAALPARHRDTASVRELTGCARAALATIEASSPRGDR